MNIFKEHPVHWWIESGDDQLGEFYRQTLEWVTSLGLDPARLAPQAAVLYHNGAYELHVDEIGRDESSGQDRWDPLDHDNLLRFRRIVPVAEGSWPVRPVEAVV
jgi:hypothetical protein